MSISTELDLAASGAKDGTCLLHTIRQGNYIHTLKPRNGFKCEIHQVVISNAGRLVIYSEDTTHRQRVRDGHDLNLITSMKVCFGSGLFVETDF